MSYSLVLYTGDGVTQNRTFSFPYLDRDHVFVEVEGVSVPFTWISDGLISLDTIPGAGEIIKVFRVTPKTRLVDYVNGSIQDAEDFDLDSTQLLYLILEGLDEFTQALSRVPVSRDNAMYQEIDLNGNTIVNSGIPSDPNDLSRIQDVIDMITESDLIPGWQATELEKGILEIATEAESVAGTDDLRAITPLKLKAVIDAIVTTPDASETVKGKVALATQAEANAGTDDVRVITPLKMKTYVDTEISGITVGGATETTAGTLEIATQAEASAGTDDARAMTPLKTKVVVDDAIAAIPVVGDATETVKGKIELATQVEASAGTDDVRAMTPLKTKTVVDDAVAAIPVIGDATETFKGKIELATSAEAVGGLDDTRAITPLKLEEVITAALLSTNPIGSILESAQAPDTNTYLEASGQLLDKLTYPDLWSLLEFEGYDDLSVRSAVTKAVPVGPDLTGSYTLTKAPTTGIYILTDTLNRVWTSSDITSGPSWVDKGFNVNPDTMRFSSATGSTAQNILLAGSSVNGDVIYTTDGGATFSSATAGGTEGIKFTCLLGGNMYAVTGHYGPSPTVASVYRSTDSGVTWNAFGVLNDLDVVELVPVEEHATIYALTDDPGPDEAKDLVGYKPSGGRLVRSFLEPITEGGVPSAMAYIPTSNRIYFVLNDVDEFTVYIYEIEHRSLTAFPADFPGSATEVTDIHWVSGSIGLLTTDDGVWITLDGVVIDSKITQVVMSDVHSSTCVDGQVLVSGTSVAGAIDLFDITSTGSFMNVNKGPLISEPLFKKYVKYTSG